MRERRGVVEFEKAKVGGSERKDCFYSFCVNYTEGYKSKHYGIRENRTTDADKEICRASPFGAKR